MTSILPIIVIILFLLMAISSYRKKKAGETSPAPEPKRAEQEPSKRVTATTPAAPRDASPAQPATPAQPAAKPQPAHAAQSAAAAPPRGCCAPAAPATDIPQDATLRRHYLTHVASMVESLTFPRPSDSALRRHYEQLIASRLEECTGDKAKLHQLVCDYQACGSTTS